jgi:hypothetical protein
LVCWRSVNGVGDEQGVWGMLWSVFTHLAGFIVDLAVGARRAEQAKDLEIALLRHQLRLLQRRSPGRPRLARWEKLTFAVLAAKRSRLTSGPRAQLARAVLLVRLRQESDKGWWKQPRSGSVAALDVA